MKWEELPLADRALLMAAAVRNGYTDIRSIKAAYANFQNQRQQTGNRYDEGGDIDNDDVEVVNVLDEHPVWKALENIDYTSVPDPEFTKEKTGQGDIEWFDELRPDGVTYRNGYHRDHPIPGTNVVLYNPNTNNEQDIKLDALHGMYKDPTYDTLNQLYIEAAKDGDVMYNAKKAYEEDLKESGSEDLDPFEQYFNNEADALLRNMFIEGTPEYIESKKYHPYKQELRQWNAHLMPYIDNIQNYLETGERPTWINIDDYQQSRLLPELTVTNQKAYGGNLFKSGGNKLSKKDYYRQQLIIRGLRGAQLEAVLANMEVESGFNPKAYNKSSGAQGLMQWLGSRKPKSWSEKDQLDYIAATYNKFGGNEWLDKNAWKRFNETTDPAEAARLFRRYWERPERSSWNATDALFKNSKGSYLPQDVNDLVAQVSNLQYDEPKAPIFTEEDQRLLDTPALAFYNPEYEDTQAPDYKPSALLEAVKLDESLWRNPANGWALYNQFANMQQGSSQDDPLNWMTMMASLSPKTTPEQKEAASTMYQLFAPQDGDYSYHGLNFAAYGGKVNRFSKGGLKDEFADKYLGIGQFPNYDADFIAANNLQYLPYSQINLNGADPENTRIVNQGGATMRAWNDDNATYLADANGNLVTGSMLKDMTLRYIEDHYEDLLNKAFLANPDKYWDEKQNWNLLHGGAPLEKPIEPKAPEFYLLAGGAHALQGATEGLASTLINPMVNYELTDNFISNTTPYSGWGNLMSENVGGPEWAWDLTHPSFTGGLVANAAKKALTVGADATRKGLINATARTAFMFPQRNAALRTSLIFRQNDWANFIQTVNGNNYYRLENGMRKIPYSADQKYFLSHSMPWAEFTGPHLIDRDFESLATGGADKFFGTKAAPYQQYRLYEFPNRTFGELKATNSAGVESEIPVNQMGYNQLHFGDNATRRVGWASAPRYPGESPEWGNIDRPLHYNRFGEGLYDATPQYSNMHLGNQTVVEGRDLADALRTSAYSVYEPTPYGVQRTLYGPQAMSFEDVIRPGFEQAPNDIHVSANSFNTHDPFISTKNWQDLFKQYIENAKKTSENIERTVPINNKSFVETNFKENPDLRFRLSLSSPATLLNNDIGNMTVQEVINTYGPEAEYWKKLYDVAKAHNFEGKYFDIAEKAQGNIATMFSLNPQDPDIITAINNAKSIYDIPEYRARFEKFGTLGNTFIEDALNRLNNVKLQGRTDGAVITGQHGVYGGAYALPDPVSPIVGIRDTNSSNYVKSMLEHELGHAAHGMRYQPKWMERHNESIRPTPKKISDTPGNKYMNEMDEIVTRAKTAVRYANENRLPGESLNAALERLTKEMDAADTNVPGDFRLLKLFFEENSLINFLLKFVGGIAIPATVAPAVMNTGGNNHALGGPLVSVANLPYNLVGKVNKFNDGGFSDLPEQRAYRRAVNLKAPYTNYEDAIDMDDSIMLRLKKFFDKGVSNCTLTASQLFNPNNPIGRARTIVNDSINNGFYEIDADHVVPGTMVIASHPNMSDYSPELNYHTMIVTGFAPNNYEYTFRDGTKYQIKKGEPLVSYSRGKASADNYVHDIPLSVYNANSEGKTYNRYYRPIDENYPQVMIPEITVAK